MLKSKFHLLSFYFSHFRETKPRRVSAYCNSIFSVLFLFLFCNSSFSKEIEVFLKNSVFYAPETGTYVETDLLITGPGIYYQQREDGAFSGTVEVSLIFKKNNEIITFEKYVIETAPMQDTSNLQLSHLDKKRFPLPPGTYMLEASFTDLNHPEKKPLNISETIMVDFDEERVSVSDITLVDVYERSDEKNLYSRSGYFMAPYVINFYPENIDKLKFYSEIYNSDKLSGEQFLATMSIRKMGQNVPVGDLHAFRKLKTQPIQVILFEFDISGLLSGNYHIVMEVRDKENNLQALKRLFFQRSKQLEATAMDDLEKIYLENTFVEHMKADALQYHLRSLAPIANVPEKKMLPSLFKSKNEDEMKRFLLFFWMTRNPTAPQYEWQEYQKTLKAVNDNFGTTLQYGFETDRGRTYIVYGPPTEILEAPREPGALPYEIWQYNATLNKQTNVKFIFYNPDLVSNNYLLIHSTANGETRNDQWQRMVHQPFVNSNSVTDPGTEIRQHFGSRASDYYRENKSLRE